MRATGGQPLSRNRDQEFPHRRLRESKFFDRIRLLRGFRGRAVVFYFESLHEFRYRQIIECIHFLHRCRETVLCDNGGRWEPYSQLPYPPFGSRSFVEHPVAT